MGSLLEMVTLCAALVWPCAWLAKVRVGGATVGASTCTPVPRRAMLCGVGIALSAMLKVAERAYCADGVKTT